ncbi:MAG: hypothetical protein HDT26_10310 [Subdoligranulum sp.]|nr:hypothetical protein [Subdoligranulum sp.]
MNMTRKTFYGLGVVASALNILGGALLIFSIQLSLLFSLATIGAGAMMLLVATTLQGDASARNLCLAGAMLTVIGMVPGALGAIAAAASWPVFAWQYFKTSPQESPLHQCAFLVLICGVVLLVGSFLPMPQMLAACIILAVAAAQGLLAWLLYRGEPGGAA